MDKLGMRVLNCQEIATDAYLVEIQSDQIYAEQYLLAFQPTQISLLDYASLSRGLEHKDLAPPCCVIIRETEGRPVSQQKTLF